MRLEKVAPEYRHLVASGLVGVFKKIWAESWGPRLEYLLRNTILSLLDYPESTLLGITRMFVDANFRKKVLAKIQDPMALLSCESSNFILRTSSHRSNFDLYEKR